MFTLSHYYTVSTYWLVRVSTMNGVDFCMKGQDLTHKEIASPWIVYWSGSNQVATVVGKVDAAHGWVLPSYSRVATIWEWCLLNSVNADGMEDKEIHRLKRGGVAADTRESIRRDTTTLPLQRIPSSRNQTPLQMLKSHKDTASPWELSTEVEVIRLLLLVLSKICKILMDSVHALSSWKAKRKLRGFYSIVAAELWLQVAMIKEFSKTHWLWEMC